MDGRFAARWNLKRAWQEMSARPVLTWPARSWMAKWKRAQLYDIEWNLLVHTALRLVLTKSWLHWQKQVLREIERNAF